jgi:ElaB/YqjD/DUF883 family membrane-anchored ribosome-binding protein
MAQQSTGGAKSGGANEQDLEVQIARLREDLAGLADTVSKLGKAKASDLGGRAQAHADEAVAASREALRAMNARAGELEQDVATRIRERPFVALAIAAGVGFVAAMMARR